MLVTSAPPATPAGAASSCATFSWGVEGGAHHAAFTGLDRDLESGTGAPFRGSVPIEKAKSEDVLLAYETNGESLAPEHGFSLRVVTGGYIGARCVKRLSEIKPYAGPSDNY